mmetsp:Transcript_19602/g.48487  ORF Transcript_19602/g.48487 Transcript_19602/m.48487 type:complete len:202 (-) Transcript_19602:2239-2844(-)
MMPKRRETIELEEPSARLATTRERRGAQEARRTMREPPVSPALPVAASWELIEGVAAVATAPQGETRLPWGALEEQGLPQGTVRGCRHARRTRDPQEVAAMGERPRRQRPLATALAHTRWLWQETPPPRRDPPDRPPIGHTPLTSTAGRRRTVAAIAVAADKAKATTTAAARAVATTCPPLARRRHRSAEPSGGSHGVKFF